MPMFKELWILIHGLTTSARPLIWTWVITLMILYVFAVAAVELIGNEKDFAADGEVQELFGDLFKSMFTMFQLMTLDTWSDTIAWPVMKTQYHLSIFFII